MVTKEDFVKAFQSTLSGGMSPKDFSKLALKYFESPDYRRWKAAKAAEDLKAWREGRAHLEGRIEDARQRGFQVETEIIPIRDGHDALRVSLSGRSLCFPSYFSKEAVDLNWAHVEEMMADPKRPCGHKDCSTSTSIDDVTITFGRGELHETGYWEIPCAICAEAFQKKFPERPVWPKKEA